MAAFSHFCVAGVAAISLDLDDTLWDFKRAVQGAEAALQSWLIEHAPTTQRVLSAPSVLSRYRQRTARQRPDLLHRLDLVRRESIRLVLLDAGADPALAHDAYEHFYAMRQQTPCFDDVVPSLSWLSARFPLIAITNGNSNLKASALRPFFAQVFTAGEFGCAKPDARIFHAAARAAGVAPAQLLHIGDDFALDYRGARAAGLQAAWLVRRPMAAEPVPAAWVIQDLHAVCEALGKER